MGGREVSEDLSHLCGCIIDPRETDRVCNALAAAGINPVAADKPGLRGSWERHSRRPVFLTDADNDTAWSQASGTCAGQAWGHALQTAVRYAIKSGDSIGNATVQIAWEPLYVLARTIIGRNSLGRGDGACIPWLAQAGFELGMLARGLYSIDLTHPQEPWAVKLSQPGAGKLPQDILDAMKLYRLAAGMKVTSLDIAADALDSGYALVRGADRCTGSTRDADGITGTQKCGGHAEHIPILFVDHKSDRIWGERNSWRGTQSQPHGGGTFKLLDGSERPVPDGVGGIRDDDVQYYIDHGDLWTAEPPDTPWGAADVKASDL